MKKIFPMLLAIMFFFVACNNQSYDFILMGGVKPSESNSSEFARTIPDEEIARMGLLDEEELPAGVSIVERKVEEHPSAASSLSARSSTSSKLISKMMFSEFEFGGSIFNTTSPIVIEYPAQQNAAETSKYTVAEYEIKAPSISVRVVDINRTATVQMILVGTIAADDISGNHPEIEVGINGEINSIANVSSVDNFVTDPYAPDTGYVVNGDNVSAADGAGMSGSETEPYRIAKLSDIAHINELIAGQSESHFVLDDDFTLETMWIVQNMAVADSDGNLVPRPITITNGKDVSIDFNGHTITFAGVPVTNPDSENPQIVYPFRIEEGGSLTIDNGPDNSIAEGAGGFTNTDKATAGIFHNYGTLTINGGTFETNGESDHAIINNLETGNLVINNARVYCSLADAAVISSGTAIINNGYFYTNSCTAVTELWFYCIINDGKMVFNNGEVYGIQGGISSGAGELIINDIYAETRDKELNGAMTNCAFYPLYVAGERGETSCTVNGGEFVSGRLTAVYVGNTNLGGDGGKNLPAVMTINGGTFNSEKQTYDVHIDYPLGDLNIKGGVFKHNCIDAKGVEQKEISEYLTDGYTVEETADGWYQIVSK